MTPAYSFQVIQEPVVPDDRGLLNAGSSGAFGWHAYGTFMRCPQAYSYRFNLGLTTAETRSALVRGTLVHVGLAHFYELIRRRQQGLDLRAVLPPREAVRDHASTMRGADPQVLDLSLAAIDEYIRTNRAHVSTVQVEGAEQRLVGAISGGDAPAPVRYTQRIDLIVRDSPGSDSRVDVWDHKTTVHLTKTFDRQFLISGQMMGARKLGVAIWGRRFRDVHVNAVQVGRFKHARFLISPAIGSLPGFLSRIVLASRQISEYRYSMDPWEWPRVQSDLVCVGRYGACEYLSLCQHGKGQVGAYLQEGGR